MVAEMFKTILWVIFFVCVIGLGIDYYLDSKQDQVVTITSCKVIDDYYEHCETVEGIDLVCNTKETPFTCEKK